MNNQTPNASSNYLASLRGLHQLHALAKEGKNESDEAAGVRDSLEAPWRGLSESEKKRIVGLSEDLYSISEPTPPREEMNSQVQRKLIEVHDARQAGKFDLALEILRTWSRHLEPALLSYLRGSIWMDAGDFATAALFFEHAAQLEPNNYNYKALHVYVSERANREEAIETGAA